MTENAQATRNENERETEEFVEDLRSAESVTDYLDGHEFTERSLAEYLTALLDEKGLERTDVVKKTGVDNVYAYEFFKGIKNKKHPGRNKLLQIAFAMGLTWRECDRLLQVADRGRLYPKNRRDAIIMFCLDRHLTVDEANFELYKRGEETLTSKD